MRKSNSGSATKRSRAKRPCYGGAVTLGGVAGVEKKECLFLTNKAVMLLKAKDRQNEQSRTNPFSAVRVRGGIGSGRLEARSSKAIRYARRVVTQFDVGAALCRHV